MATVSTGCAHRPPASSLHIEAPASLRAKAERAPRPVFAKMPPPAGTGTAERAWLTEHVIKPLAVFSVQQEVTVNTVESQRDGLAAIIDAANAALAQP